MPENATTFEILEPKEKPSFQTMPTQKTPIEPGKGVSFTLDFARVRPLIESDAPLPRPNRTGPLPQTANDAEIEAWEAASDEAWDSIED